jgi:hypothetical protein
LAGREAAQALDQLRSELSNDSNVTLSFFRSLHSQSTDSPYEQLLESVALEILPLVSPFLGSHESSVRNSADQLLSFLGQHGNSKELFLSGSEMLEKIALANIAGTEDEADSLQQVVGLVNLFTQRAYVPRSETIGYHAYSGL